MPPFARYFGSLLLGGALAALTGGIVLPQSSPPPAAQLEQGRSLYRSKGCYECHGLAGQGAMGVAPALRPLRRDGDAFGDYLRHPAGQMPPYGRAILSDEEAQSIFAYLRALPKTPGAAEIPMLAPYVSGHRGGGQPSGAPAPSATDFAAGAGVYRQYCAACHGANLQGGTGPSLRDEGGRRDLGQIIALVRAPPPRMPRLFPSPLSEHDLVAVAAYIHAKGGASRATAP